MAHVCTIQNDEIKKYYKMSNDTWNIHTKDLMHFVADM